MKKFSCEKKIGLWIFAVVVFAGVIFDLISKHFTPGIKTNVIPGVISFEYVKNFGAAWSLFSGSTLALTIITAFAVVFLLFYAIASKTKSKFFHISIGLIVSGAFGNLFDRLVFGYVRDFIKLEFMNFPIFNVADSLLTVGVICLVIFYIIDWVKEYKKKKKEKN